eukprot:425245_1
MSYTTRRGRRTKKVNYSETRSSSNSVEPNEKIIKIPSKKKPIKSELHKKSKNKSRKRPLQQLINNCNTQNIEPISQQPKRHKCNHIIQNDIDDNKTVESEILEKEMTVIVKTLSGRCYPIHVELNDIIWTIKLKLQSTEGINASQQRLLFGGRQLEDGKTLSDYNIKNKSIIHMIWNLRGQRCDSWQIFIKHPNGTEFPIDVMPNATIPEVKSIIYEKCKIHPSKQRLHYYRPLDDKRRLSDYGIQRQTTVFLLMS